MVDDGLSETEARRRIFMVDRFGLLTDQMPNLLDFQRELVTPRASIAHWDTEAAQLSLMDVVRNVHPTVLIGVSGQPGLFSEEIVKEMHRHCPRPIIMPLSNPTSWPRPSRRICWSGLGVARLSPPAARSTPSSMTAKPTTSPSAITPIFSPVWGWGSLPVKPSASPKQCLSPAVKRWPPTRLWRPAKTGGLLPPVEEIEMISRAIAADVARAAQQDGVAPQIDEVQLAANIDKTFWRARYTAYKRSSL